MAIVSNQFGIHPLKGTLTLFPNVNLVDCQVDVSEVGTILAGDPVVIVDAAGATIKVKKAAISDKFLGCVPYSVKGNEYVAGEMVRVALDYCCLQMEASAAVAAGIEVQIDPATGKVAPQAGTNTVIGDALGKAAADGDLIPVMIKVALKA